MAKSKQNFTKCSKNWNNISIREDNHNQKKNFQISGQKIKTKKQTKYLRIIKDGHLSDQSGTFFIGWWESREKYFWPFKPFLKLKTTFYKYQTSVKIKIGMTCVYKEYEVKIMIQEHYYSYKWLQLQKKFLLGYEMEIDI